MTTVDVYIRRVDPGRGADYIGGPGYLSLHSYWVGPATEVSHSLVRRFTAGELTGPWHSSYIETTLPGAALRSILADLTQEKTEAPQAGPQEGVWDQIVAFRKAIDDDANYAIKAMEVYPFAWHRDVSKTANVVTEGHPTLYHWTAAMNVRGIRQDGCRHRLKVRP